MLDTKFPANQSTSQKPIRNSGYAQSISREKALNDERDPQRDAWSPVPAFHHAVLLDGTMGWRRVLRVARRLDGLQRLAVQCCSRTQPPPPTARALAKNGRIMQIVWLASSCGPAVKPTYHSCRLMYRTYDVGMHVPTIQENPENLCRVPFVLFVPYSRQSIPQKRILWKNLPRYYLQSLYDRHRFMHEVHRSIVLLNLPLMHRIYMPPKQSVCL
ncbi:hypothetical protein F4805DRAFT_428538 [Annulohypoxylon moriforme]|nr:hypothetical protein F4805DRAFT_428538 [Annulohypoxylon moriforme]